MISFFETSLLQLSVHRVGNKLLDEYFFLSDRSVVLTEGQTGYFFQFFLKPFTKTNEVYNFYHESGDVNSNVVYSYVKDLLQKQAFTSHDFQELSKILAVQLYGIANHPKIKGGELYVALFSNVQIEGELHNAIGIFKSEQKETFLKLKPTDGHFDVSFENDAISLDKLDKGCLIFNTDDEVGYKVVCIDNSSAKDAIYWKDEYLKLSVRNDNYNQTNNLLSVYKNFVTDKLPEDYEISQVDKCDLLNKGLKYFKEKESFDMAEFGSEVIGNVAAAESFSSYKKNYAEEFETPIGDHFEIHSAAVKKQNKAFKSIIKLDKNFHVYLHGNKDLIEKGYDADKSMNFMKLYYKEEA